jgi:hypothetical protein
VPTTRGQCPLRVPICRRYNESTALDPALSELDSNLVFLLTPTLALTHLDPHPLRRLLLIHSEVPHISRHAAKLPERILLLVMRGLGAWTR